MHFAGGDRKTMGTPRQISFWFITATLVLVGWLHLGIPLVATLFSYFALTKLNFLKGRGRWAAVVLFLILIAGFAYGLGFFINHMVRALPEIADEAIPLVIQWAKQHQMDLPFTDYDSLKELLMETVKGQVHYIGSFARFARGA